MSGDVRDVVIIGAGFSGLCMAIRLQQEGRTFVVLEKNAGIGGTWWENRYPGCACDVPSHLYSFSFEPNPGWTRAYAPQEEIRTYLDRIVVKYDLARHIRLRTTATSASWDEAAGLWRVTAEDGATFEGRALVFALGALNRPAYPTIDGLAGYEGRAFHSATWDRTFDLRGRTVAIVGTGASSAQIIPEIVNDVGRLHVFQRTAPWVLPRHDEPIPAWRRRLYAKLPLLQRLARWWVYFKLESRAVAFTRRPSLMRFAKWLGHRHLERQVADPELRRKLLPTYQPGCKRLILSDDYYPALARPNVEVVTERISHATSDGLVTADGVERRVDAIIYGTGFHVADQLTPMDVRGRDGVLLNEAWLGGIEAYLGTTVAGFPNLYLMTGPNTGLGHNSIVFMIEAQVDYVLCCLRAAAERTAAAIEVSREAQEAFNSRLIPRLARTIWASGCRSWYLDRTGRNSTMWPGFTFEYWFRTRRIKSADYHFAPSPPAAKEQTP